ncbi:unnamed protein product [Paramecium pentaurelia]|uniref:Uncharacterized protein n=1 Tax=Paramecium pentaurelia TaxID=43138 RepID=A0A8S1S350_9CILI|nr:unnamed protein product [Paramecium pentaurelia]
MRNFSKTFYNTELLQKQNEYFFQENQQQSDLKDQIKYLQIQNEQIIQENKELLKIKKLNLEILEQLNNEKYISQKLQAERDQLLDQNKNKTDLIEQYINKNQDYERNNKDLNQQVEYLEIQLEKYQQENHLLEQKIINYTQKDIQFHLEDITKIIIEELKKIEIQCQIEKQKIIQRKQLAQNLLIIFNENLRKPLLNHDLTFRHDFNDNKILGQEEINKNQFN